MKYLRYRRVSKNEKDTGSVSLEWQAAEIQRWCDRHKIKDSQDFCDNGVTAQRPLGRRKEGKKLLVNAENGPCTVICAHQDRIFRSTREFLNQTFQWASKGILFVSVNGGTDLTTSEGRCYATCMAAFHQLEREKTSERAISRGAERKQLGMRYLRDAPYGFRFEGEVTDEKGKKSGGTLLRNEEEQKQIAWMKEKQSQGWTLRKIAAGLNAAGVPTRRGKPWKHSSVATILDTAKARLSKRKPKDGREHLAPDLTIHVEPDEKDGDE